MRHGGDAEFLLNTQDEIDGLGAGRPPGPHGDGDESRIELLEILDGSKEASKTGIGFRRKELEGHDRFFSGIEVGHVHGGSLALAGRACRGMGGSPRMPLSSSAGRR